MTIVRSSISNSERGVPVGNWIKTWVVALAVTTLVLSAGEAYWRRAGFVPSMNDDAQAWVGIRSKVKAESTVLLGTSRSQSAVDPTIWASALDTSPSLQLSLAFLASFVP